MTEARRCARQFEATWGKAYPGAVATATDGLDELVARLHYPRGRTGLGSATPTSYRADLW